MSDLTYILPLLEERIGLILALCTASGCSFWWFWKNVGSYLDTYRQNEMEFLEKFYQNDLKKNMKIITNTYKTKVNSSLELRDALTAISTKWGKIMKMQRTNRYLRKLEHIYWVSILMVPYSIVFSIFMENEFVFWSYALVMATLFLTFVYSCHNIKSFQKYGRGGNE